ncbi:tol-pal system protein YbgF [Denitrovibrio acetiphilus DSM 12809]|uniref:Tol-pal system protein YbgF n=1 Tax=Denitrovibrio acetiphilus (strain DSM 12809 / NBRC 114555 / N2460) TaxID=522772 RepID=D4H363_DENA2|nr:tol-pal system protein YbgF [Denitrovibrio acetiphilus]ADD69086.1 tol-pal system protein YbgF [Denitrovibrio acetiphilus DSM 12809]
MYKKFLIVMIAGLSLSACTGNQDLVQQSLNNIKDEMLGIQSTIGDMQVQIQGLDKDIRVNTESINRNSDAISQLREEMTVTNSDVMEIKERVTELERTKMELSADHSPIVMKSGDEEVIIVEDNIQDKIGLYTYAYELYRNGKYAESETKFNEFLMKYPDVERSDNAMYWLGEIKYAEKDYESAVMKFQELVERYPEGNKVPDALLKMGYSYGNISDKDNAVKSLQKVVNMYPESDAARLATQKLRFWGVN